MRPGLIERRQFHYLADSQIIVEIFAAELPQLPASTGMMSENTLPGQSIKNFPHRGRADSVLF